MARRPAQRQRPNGGQKNGQKNGQRSAQRTGPDNEGIIPQLARGVREVESAVQRGRVTSSVRTKFQVVALLAREERSRVKVATDLAEPARAEQLKRLDGIGTILAKTAAREPALFALLDEGAEVSFDAKELKREMQSAAGLEVAAEEPEPVDEAMLAAAERQVVPQSVVARQLSNPFLTPDFSAAPPRSSGPRQLMGWELIEPLLESFERASDGASACMALPEPTTLRTPSGRELMKHQAEVIGAASDGAPHVPARRRAGAGQDGPGAARRPDRQRLPAAGRRPERREDQLGPRGCALDAEPRRHRDPWQRVRRRRVRRHRGDQLRDPRPARRLARHVRFPRHGGRRGPLHQEQDVAALAARAADLRQDPRAHRRATDDGADRHPADQRHRGLPRDLAVPRLDRREAARGPS